MGQIFNKIIHTTLIFVYDFVKIILGGEKCYILEMN